MSISLVHRSLAVLCFALLLSFRAGAETRIWPGVAPCDTSLQACVDAAVENDTIEVLSNTEIDADVFINKSLRLIAGDGFRPGLGTGHSLTVFSNGSDATAVEVEGFRLREGTLRGSFGGSGEVTVGLRRMDITCTTEGATGGPCIAVYASNSVRIRYDISENHLSTTSMLNAIDVWTNPGTLLDGRIHDNRIDVTPTHVPDPFEWGGPAIAVEMNDGDIARIYANRIRGETLYGILISSEAQVTDATAIIANNAVQNLAPGGDGVRILGSADGRLNTRVINNSVTGFKYGLNIIGNNVHGDLVSNVIAYNEALGWIIQGSQISDSHTAYFGNGGSLPALGADSITSDPLLRRGTADTRLSKGSPAINAGSALALQQLQSEFGIPLIDADGLRRVKSLSGGYAPPDIGAYEFGDHSLIHRVAPGNISGYTSRIDSAELDGDQTRLMMLTASLAPDTYRAATNPAWTGVDFVDNHHRVVNQDANTPAAGASFHVFVPARGIGLVGHTTSPTPTNMSNFVNLPLLSSDEAYLVQPYVNGDTLFNHGVGISIETMPSNRIGMLRTLDLVPFAPQQRLLAYSQDPSYSAFHVHKKIDDAKPTLPLHHPSMDGNPCARAYVSPANPTPNTAPHALDYDRGNGHWLIRNTDGSPMPPGSRYAILLDEAATDLCHYDHIFHNGADSD